MVLEKEAEDLKTCRNLLADEAPYQTDFLQNNQDIRRGLNIIPMETNRGVGGMISGQDNNHSDPICNPPSINHLIAVNQEAVWKTEATHHFDNFSNNNKWDPSDKKRQGWNA